MERSTSRSRLGHSGRGVGYSPENKHVSRLFSVTTYRVRGPRLGSYPLSRLAHGSHERAVGQREDEAATEDGFRCRVAGRLSCTLRCF